MKGEPDALLGDIKRLLKETAAETRGVRDEVRAMLTATRALERMIIELAKEIQVIRSDVEDLERRVDKLEAAARRH